MTSQYNLQQVNSHSVHGKLQNMCFTSMTHGILLNQRDNFAFIFLTCMKVMIFLLYVNMCAYVHVGMWVQSVMAAANLIFKYSNSTENFCSLLDLMLLL